MGSMAASVLWLAKPESSPGFKKTCEYTNPYCSDSTPSYAPYSSPFAKKRYADETKRLLSVLESHLAKHEYLAGDKYGIADIKTFPWVRICTPTGLLGAAIGLDFSPYPSVEAWVKLIEERPAVVKGLAYGK